MSDVYATLDRLAREFRAVETRRRDRHHWTNVDHRAEECAAQGYETCGYCGCCEHGKRPRRGCKVTLAPAGMRCPDRDCGCEGEA